MRDDEPRSQGPFGNEEVVVSCAPRCRAQKGHDRARHQRQWDVVLTQARRVAHDGALRDGLSPSDSDDVASLFVLCFLRRGTGWGNDGNTNAPDQDADPRYLLPLFLRCQISRLRAHIQREVTCLNADANLSDVSCASSVQQCDRTVEQRALWGAVAEAVKNLPSLQQDALVGRVLNDEPISEIAARHNVGEAAVRKSSYRAQITLRVRLRDWEEK